MVGHLFGAIAENTFFDTFGPLHAFADKNLRMPLKRTHVLLIHQQMKLIDFDRFTKLTEIFRAAGAPDPESWARSELQEGIPQLIYFSFCKSLWQIVKDEKDTAWIDREIASSDKYPNDPCAQIGPALAEMKAKGVSEKAITDFARVLQYEALYHACSVLDHSRQEDVPSHAWGLYAENKKRQLKRRLGCTHEILLSLDPSGREMRPQKNDD
jgi:hypothetical protein